jgi:N-acyl-D-amino-acid deacylase
MRNAATSPEPGWIKGHPRCMIRASLSWGPPTMALRCDTIIRDATIFDGTGARRRLGDVGVTGDRIVAVGDLGGASADREIIATGKAIAPGFIDSHTHDDRAVLCGPACTLC